MKVFSIFLILFSFSKSFATENDTNLKRCNLTYASSIIKQRIEREISNIAEADLKTLNVTFLKERLSWDPVVEREWDYNSNNVYWDSTVTGYFRIQASVSLQNGKSLSLKRDFFAFNQSSLQHSWDDLYLKVKLSNRYENGRYYSNSCSVDVIGGSKNFWGYTNPLNDGYPYVEYRQSYIDGQESYVGPFEPKEPPQVGG